VISTGVSFFAGGECADEVNTVVPAAVAPELATGVQGFVLNRLAVLLDGVACAATIIECCLYARANTTA
jgi:hypothetical protein